MANIFPVLQTASLPDCSPPPPRWKLHTCMQQYLPNFKVISWAIDVLFRNSYLWLFLEVFDLDNFSSNFKAMGFSLRSLVRFEFAFMQVETYQSIFILLHVDIPFPGCFDSFIKNWIDVDVWVYLCVLYSISLCLLWYQHHAFWYCGSLV